MSNTAIFDQVVKIVVFPTDRLYHNYRNVKLSNQPERHTMSVPYYIDRNFLTTPPSYKMRPVARTILEIDDISRLITLNVPNIPFETAKTVLQTFADLTAEELAAGNTVKLANFISITLSMLGRLDSPEDPIPTDTLKVNAKVAANYLAKVKQLTTYEFIGYTDKAPSIVSEYDTVTGIANYIRDGFAAMINGSQMGFDQSDTTQGVFLLSPAGNNIRQTSLVMSNPSNCAVVAEIDDAVQPAGAASVEQVLSIVTKYTENGEYRTGTYSTKIRTTNVITDTNKLVFVIGSDLTSGATISAYTGAQVDCRVQLEITPQGELKARIGTLAGVFGDKVTISAADDYVLTGLAADVTLTVSDYDQIFANVLARNKFIQEVCDLSPLTP